MDSEPEFSKFEHFDQKINAQNCSILPGFVDSHTHPVWEGDRINEFKMKVNWIIFFIYAIQHNQYLSINSRVF